MSALDEIRKRRKQKEEEEQKKKSTKTSAKTSTANGLEYINKQRQNLASTGKLDLNLPIKDDLLTSSPVVSKKKVEAPTKNDTPWYKKVFTKGEFDDGYQFGDVTKTILGTSTDLVSEVGKGILSPIESVVDVGANALASGANLASKVAGKGLGVLDLEKTEENLRSFANNDLTETMSNIAGNVNPAGMLYNVVNGTPENIFNPAGISYDKDKSVVENIKTNYKNLYTDKGDPVKVADDYEKSSLMGEYAEKVTELVGYGLSLAYGGAQLSGASKTASVGTSTFGATANAGNIGINIAGKTLNIPTLALAGGMAGGLEEANSKEDVTELERWTKALSSGAIEGITEGMFGMLKVGGITNEAGQEIFDVAASKLSSNFKSQLAKTLTAVGVKASGEALEEFLSYGANYLVDNGLIDKLGQADFSKEWNWGEVLEQMALAFVSAGISQGGSTVIETNSAIQAAEEQLGRKLTNEEKALVTQASLEGALENKIAELEQKVSQESDTQVQSQRNLTVEEIDNQIALLESQLTEDLSDAEYDTIVSEIQKLENQAEQLEQNGPITTQEVETNSLVDAPSNTLKNVNNEVQDANVEENASNTEQDAPTQKGAFLNEETSHKQQQLEIINKSNPAGEDNIHTWVRSEEDIKTFDEAFFEDGEYSGMDPDFTEEMAQKAKETGKVTIYSSYPIKNGVFVSPSQMEASQYAGGDASKLYSKEVDINDVAWIDGAEGQYAKVEKQETPTTEKSESISPVKESNLDKYLKAREEYNNNKDISKRSELIEKMNKLEDKLTPEEMQTVIKLDSQALNVEQTDSNVQKELAPIKQATKELKQVQKEVSKQVKELKQEIKEFEALTKEQYQEYDKMYQESLEHLQKMKAPVQEEVVHDELDTISLDDKNIRKATKDFKKLVALSKTDKMVLDNTIKELSKKGDLTVDDIHYALREYEEFYIREKNDFVVDVRNELASIDYLRIPRNFNRDLDMAELRSLAKGRLKFKMSDNPNVDTVYEELSSQYPQFFPDDVTTSSQQFEVMVDVASTPIYEEQRMTLPDDMIREEAQHIYDVIQSYREGEKFKDSEKAYKEYKKSMKGVEAPTIEEELSPVKETKPVKEEISKEAFTKKIEELSGEIKNELGYVPKDPTKAQSYEDEEIAEILDEEPTTDKENKAKTSTLLRINVFDKGTPFEDLALKTKNFELDAKWDYTLTSEARAQYVMGNGHYDIKKVKDSKGKIKNKLVKTSKSLNAIMNEVGKTGKTKNFYNYMYHKHNVDRMNLEERFGIENKPVFGESVTSEKSQRIVDQYEEKYPEFKEFAEDVYRYVKADRRELVRNGVISQETAQLWDEMYPHYVPIRRAGHNGPAINVPLDTGRTGINAPVKKATGGSSDILPLFDTMAMRTIQTQRATAKNNFGIELKNTLKGKTTKSKTSLDEVIDNVDNQDGLLQEGKNGSKPTFTVFENGEKVTFEITPEMYSALKPLSDDSILSKTNKLLNTASNFHRGVLTQYNPVFMLTNGIKDIQDVLINSQHPVKTYASIPEAFAQLSTKGYWYREYMRNGGEQNSYFDSQENTFDTKNKGIKKALDMFPLKQIAQMNDFIEMTPRLAEYIASRKAGKSVESSMLDAARVTTNFKAGGNLTKWANRNGFTFLNASVQGFNQQVRNFRQAQANGLKGWANLAIKFTVAGLPAILLNSLLWEDDEDYEELSDYVKQNYYVVGKFGDGQFIRIPKGRATAVIQDAIEQVRRTATGDDEADYEGLLKLFFTNLAPANPLEQNIFAPIGQVATNTTWYGEDLVPTRLQDLPPAEQYDESTDEFSKWLGGVLNVSPYKINYLLDQYTGGVGDLVLPMMTQEATNTSTDSALGTILAPFTKKFTTDGVMNNKYVGDFYDKSEELTTGAKKSDATDEDILKNKFINSVKAEMNELYKKKREIQNDTSLSKTERYEQVREVQKEINSLSEGALDNYENVLLTENYATVADRSYRKNTKGEWVAVNQDELNDIEYLELSLEERNDYFSAKNEISNIANDYKEDKEDINEEYEDNDEALKEQMEGLSDIKKRDIIKTISSTGLSEEAQAYLYKKYYNNKTVDKIVQADIGISNYFDYVQQEFTADYNAKGNAIPNSRKEKVISYVNGYDLTIPQKAILIKSTNTFKFNDYNDDIVAYVDNLPLTYEEKVDFLEDLDMTVYDDGTVGWE